MSLFTNAEKVEINGKEVQSIKTENATIYEKPVDNTIIYENITENTHTGGTWNTITNNITNLPSKFELSVELYTDGVKQDEEQRLYLCPTSTFNGNGQPSEAVFVGFNRPTYAEYGYREHNITSFSLGDIWGNYPNVWIKFKIIKEGTICKYYINDTLVDTKGYVLPSDTSYTLCTANWFTGSTFKYRNLKIKELE